MLIAITAFGSCEVLSADKQIESAAFFGVALLTSISLLGIMLLSTRLFGTHSYRTARAKTSQPSPTLDLQNDYFELLKSIPAVFWRMNSSTFGLTFVSPQVEAVSGFPVETWTRDPDFWKTRADAGDTESILRNLKAAGEGQHVAFEHRMIDANENAIWLRSIIQRSVQGDLTGISAVITDRKSAELALLAEHKQLQNLLDSLPAAVSLFDEKGNLLFSNPSARALFGEDLSHFASITAPHPDRRLITRYAIPLHWKDRDIAATVVVGIDTTEIRRTNTALRLSEQRLASFFEQTLMGVIELDKDYKIRLWNPAAAAIFGYSREEAIGRNPLDLIVPPEHNAAVGTLLSELRHGVGGHHSLNQNIRKDGSRFDCEWFNTALKEENGTTGITSLVHDISDRTTAEKSLRELGGRLLRAQEEERCRIARELHDSIGQELAILAMQIHGGKADKSELYSRAKELGRKVSDLSHQLHSSRVQLLGLSAAIKAVCRDFAEDRNIEVLCSCTDVSKHLDANTGLSFYRILQETLHNIKKHSRATQVQVELRERNGEIILSVRDNGHGFDPTLQANWNGLGLISMRERMHSIGGNLNIQSQPGQGTTIEAVAPIRTADSV